MMRTIVYLLVFLITMSCKNDKRSTDIDFSSNVDDESSIFKDVDEAHLFAGNLIRVDSFPSKYITPRPVSIWLPKDYSNDKKYSVLYMHDGQMLFDSITSWNKQEWKVDEWATKLQEADKTKNFIVVGIHNIPQVRWQDLFPQKAINYFKEGIKDSLMDLMGSKDFKLNGDNYLRFMVEELKPKIDQTYSVYTDQDNTFVMGSSMGGLMSMYAISEYPGDFGGAACLSTHWPGAMPMPNNPYPEAIFKYIEDHLPDPNTHRLYFDYGNKTLDQHYPQYASTIDDLLEAAGYDKTNSRNLFFEGTDHSENSWNKRLDKPLMFLLGED